MVRLAVELLLLLVLLVCSVGGARTQGRRRRQLKGDRDDWRKNDSKGGGEFGRHVLGEGGGGDPSCVAMRPHKHGSHDLGIRFNKFEMQDNYDGNPIYLTWEDYPLNDEIAYKLSHYSTVQSVVMPHDHELHGVCIERFIQAVGGYPSFPSSDPLSPFWKELEEVVDVQKLRLMGQIPSFFRLPDLWLNFTAAEVAEAVHDEYPGYHQATLIESLLAGGLKIDHTCIPFRSQFDFLGAQVRLSTLNTWSIGLVGPPNFCAKHHVGRPRPEEIAWLIYTDQLTSQHGVPQDLIDKIKDRSLSDDSSFTAYPEGSPTHPAWPAMHSAASSSSLWLPVVADLTEDQYCQVLRTDFAVAYARTVAGVHYPTDNIAGLNMGQKVVAEKLAQHLSDTYGGDTACYQEKIDRLRFDWETYDPVKCKVTYRHEEDYY